MPTCLPENACTSSRSGRALLAWAIPLCVVAGSLVTGCALIGIESDEIDVADEDTGNGEFNDDEVGESGDEVGTEDDAGSTDEGTTGEEDTTGDEETGTDGPVDEDTGDTDADGTADTGDSGGCEELFDVVEVQVGQTPVMLLDGDDLVQSSCGGPGPEAAFVFVAPADGDYAFSVESAEFDAIISLGGPGCAPFDELDCAGEAVDVELSLFADEAVYIIIDSLDGLGAATLFVTAL